MRSKADQSWSNSWMNEIECIQKIIEYLTAIYSLYRLIFCFHTWFSFHCVYYTTIIQWLWFESLFAEFFLTSNTSWFVLDEVFFRERFDVMKIEAEKKWNCTFVAQAFDPFVVWMIAEALFAKYKKIRLLNYYSSPWRNVLIGKYWYFSFFTFINKFVKTKFSFFFSSSRYLRTNQILYLHIFRLFFLSCHYLQYTYTYI